MKKRTLEQRLAKLEKSFSARVKLSDESGATIQKEISSLWKNLGEIKRKISEHEKANHSPDAGKMVEVPDGWRLIDPAKDGPKRPGDMWCFKEGKSESWKHVSETCDTNFYDASFYIRKIETPEKKQVEMPPVFRQLIPGEIIKEGDMGLNKDDGKFYAITYCIGQSVEGDVIIRKKAEPKEQALLPCPFCGGKAKLEHRTTDEYYVYCSEVVLCPIRSISKNWKTKSEAIAAWNRRDGK